MIDPRIDAIQQMKQINKMNQQDDLSVNNKQPEISFGEMMKSYLEDANNLQLEADEDIRKAIAGEDIDPHKVMIAVQKANLSFELVMEIRNKMLEAYKEVTKMNM
ncbi:MAG: flagellar hook-basal body complex protein FliE [Candidatus Cloacimonetes bacterium]|nr:flagellar hook-basal body complex protein FliE [Candidatus Cloacimonadota bacterium]